MTERQRNVKFCDSELQILKDEVQRLLRTARMTSHCVRRESHLRLHSSISECCRCFQTKEEEKRNLAHIIKITITVIVIPKY